jgi:LPXTG-motif cell wall-anchored protein
VYCSTFVPEIQQPGEMFPAGIGEFTVSDVPAQDAFPFAQCEVTNRYYEGDLVVTKSVVNDDGGAATPDQFTAEVYTEPGGSLVTTATCAADGSCIDATFPIGDYRIGESGPEGYTPSVSCSVTREPDGPPPIGTTPPVGLIEAIAGDDAVATVEPYGEVTCAITNDDPTTTTTTTTTTTLAPTTTTTTTLAPQLPPTGDSNGTLAIIALVLIASGGVLLALRRRPA